MFINGNQTAQKYMMAFMESLQGGDEKVNAVLADITKDIGHGFLECAFEDIAKLNEDLVAKIPQSYFLMNTTRNAYCTSPFSDQKSMRDYQQAVYAILTEHNHDITNVDIDGEFC